MKTPDNKAVMEQDFEDLENYLTTLEEKWGEERVYDFLNMYTFIRETKLEYKLKEEK